MAIIIKQIRVLVCPCHDVVVMEVRFCVRVFALSVISFLSFFFNPFCETFSLSDSLRRVFICLQKRD